MTGTLLALSQLAMPVAAAAEPEKKKEEPKTENLGEMVVDATTGKKLYKPERLSSPKYVTPLKDVAQTITVIPKEVIQDQGATTLIEVLRNVPGISVQAGEGGGASSTAGDAFNLRGFSGTNSVFVDGFRNDSLLSRDVYNLESVEAFLGPTGTDVGRGTASGYINLATKSPQKENFYRGTVGYNTGGTMRNTIDINQTLGKGESANWMGETALRLNGLFQFGGVAGRDNVNRDSWALAPSLAFGLGTDTRLILQYEHVTQDNTPDYGVPSRNGYPLRGVEETWYYGTGVDFEHIEQDTFTVRLEHEFSENFKLLSQTRYSESDRLAVITGLGFNATSLAVTRTRQANERHNRILSNQTSLSAKFDTGPFKHSLVGGMELTWDEQISPTLMMPNAAGVPTAGSQTLPTLPAPYIPNPLDPLADFALVRSPIYGTSGATDTLGLYVSDTIEFAKHWQISGGIRSDIYDTRYYSVAVPATGTTTDRILYSSSGDTLFSGKLALSYKPTADGMIYLAYGTSMTPPGTANFTLSDSQTNQNNPKFDPQESENIELGAKWDLFDEKLSLSGAVFHTENKNVVYLAVPSAPNDPGSYSVDGGQTIDGVTLGAAGKLTENWMIQANVTHLNAELDQPGNANDGRDLTLTPEISGSLWTTYKLPWNLEVGGGIRYQGHAAVNAANTINVPSYAVVDALVKYQVNERIWVQANVYNLLNREYRTSVNNNGGRYNPGTPLSAMITTGFSF